MLVHLRTSELHVLYTPSSRSVNRNHCFCLPTRPAPRGTKSRAEAPHAACAAIKKGECWSVGVIKGNARCLDRSSYEAGSSVAGVS